MNPPSPFAQQGPVGPGTDKGIKLACVKLGQAGRGNDETLGEDIQKIRNRAG